MVPPDHPFKQRVISSHSKESLRLWLRMLAATNLIEKDVKAFLQENFSSTLPRFDILAALERSPEGLTMGQLSEQLLVSNGNVTGVVARLQNDGCVEREQSETDGRSYRVKLTSKGRNLFLQMAGPHEAMIDAVFDDFSEEEMHLLSALLEKIRTSSSRPSKKSKDSGLKDVG